MSQDYILVIRDFNPKPYGRYNDDCDTCHLTSGQAFRENILLPRLHQFQHVTVDLTGFNRYGRSFLDEAFAGLINEGYFKKSELDQKLTYKHDDLESIIHIIDERINSAEKNRKK